MREARATDEIVIESAESVASVTVSDDRHAFNDESIISPVSHTPAHSAPSPRPVRQSPRATWQSEQRILPVTAVSSHCAPRGREAEPSTGSAESSRLVTYMQQPFAKSQSSRRQSHQCRPSAPGIQQGPRCRIGGSGAVAGVRCSPPPRDIQSTGTPRWSSSGCHRARATRLQRARRLPQPSARHRVGEEQGHHGLCHGMGCGRSCITGVRACARRVEHAALASRCNGCLASRAAALPTLTCLRGTRGSPRRRHRRAWR